MPRLLVTKETTERETRVASTPEAVKKLIGTGWTVAVERGAGTAANLVDESYQTAGAQLVEGGASAWGDADVILKVACPSETEASWVKAGATVIGFAQAHKNAIALRRLAERGVNFAAMELVPRISRAQGMDALSSQASIGGYKAALLAATHLDKYFPLLMTAAGTVQPARIVIMGAGVAGLQALATCRRLGAVVEVSDVRPQVKEQVQSLGGRFIDLPVSGEGEGGYAKELTQEQLAQQQQIIRERTVDADAVITTALIPGRPAPVLVTEEMVQAMRPGAVIVDMAVEQGGNCPLSKINETVCVHGVTIIGHPNLPATLAADASLLYARNLQNLLAHLAPDAQLHFDLEDEITTGALLLHEGVVRNAQIREAIGL